VRPPLILLLCLGVFASTFSIGAFPALLPELGGSARLADWQLGLVAGAFGLARMTADLPVGLLVNRRLRELLAAAPFVLAAGLLLLASGGAFPVLVLGRAVMGVAHALAMVAGLTALLRYQAAGGLAAALSAYELSAMLGMLGGTIAVGLLPATLPWNLALLATAAPLLVAVAVLPLVLRSLPAREPTGGPPSGRGTGGAGAAPVTSGVVLAFATGTTVATTYSLLEQFAIPLRGSREFGLDRHGVAGLLMTAQLADIVCLLPFGFLSDRRGIAPVLGGILLVFAAGTAMVAFGGFALLVVGCALFGIGMAGWTLPLGLLRADTPARWIGWRTALYRVGVDGGIFLGPFLGGLLAASAPRLLPGLCAATLALLGVLLLRRRPTSVVRPVSVPASSASVSPGRPGRPL
jgi:MFS family permease